MTKHEAAIITAYTQTCVGRFEDYHRYAEKLLGRQLLTHELAKDDIISEIREKAKKDIDAIEITDGRISKK